MNILYKVVHKCIFSNIVEIELNQNIELLFLFSQSWPSSGVLIVYILQLYLLLFYFSSMKKDKTNFIKKKYVAISSGRNFIVKFWWFFQSYKLNICMDGLLLMILLEDTVLNIFYHYLERVTNYEWIHFLLSYNMAKIYSFILDTFCYFSKWFSQTDVIQV